jgi:hypothetical protein
LKKRKRRQGNEGRKEKDKYPTVVVFVLSSLLPLLLQSGKRNRIKVTFSPSMLQGVPKRLALFIWATINDSLDYSILKTGWGWRGGRRVYLVSALDWVSRISNFPPQ